MRYIAFSFDLAGEDVLIPGAGPVGLMSAAICQFVGARHVVLTDINDFRLEIARKMGIKNIVNVKKENLEATMQRLGMTEGFDVGLEMSGNPDALQKMFQLLNNGAKVAMLGIPPKKLLWIGLK